MLKNPILKIKRKAFLAKNKKRLKNSNPTVISSNCNGALILHDLNLRFNSPFVNLWIKPKDFIKLLKDFDTYMEANLEEVTEEGINYPIGRLIDISIYFKHYSNFADVLEKWEERKKRIDKNNFFVLFSDRDGCTYDDLLEFDKLPIANKIVFTHKPYKEISSAFYIKGFEGEKSVGMCADYMPETPYMKYYNQFDYVDWFNNGINKKLKEC